MLDRPDKLNAMTVSMYRQFGEMFDRLNADDSVRCVVLRGAGARAFCPGSDIGEFESQRANRDKAKAYATLTLPPTLKLWNCPHPTLALIHGACVGGGFELAMMCDIRICGQSSRFGIPINRLGLTVDYDELKILTDTIGQRAALEILLEGRLFGADEALARGLVSRTVVDGEVETATYEVARRIAEGAPLVNRWHKKFLRRLADPRPLSDAEREEAYDCYETEDFKAGLEAFSKKVKPAFKGG
jgi:enoyl-CoA hydratase/carnithine racemase